MGKPRKGKNFNYGPEVIIVCVALAVLVIAYCICYYTFLKERHITYYFKSKSDGPKTPEELQRIRSQVMQQKQADAEDDEKANRWVTEYNI